MPDTALAYPQQAVQAETPDSIPTARQFTKREHPGALPAEADTLIKRILVPTDFSPASAKALTQAVILAGQCEAAVTILHVIDVNAQVDAESANQLMQRLWEQGSEAIGRLAWSVSGQLEVQTVIEEGLAWDAIVQKSRN